MRSRRPPRHAGAQVMSTQMADGYEPSSAALYPRIPIRPDPWLTSDPYRDLSTATGHHALRCGPNGEPLAPWEPGDEVARPPRLASRWQQWRRERACRRLTRHCWHPADAMICWFCCMCGGDTDGMPAQRCTICTAAP